MSDPLYAITLAAADLKAVAPEQFAKLVEAFALLEATHYKAFLAADAASIFGAQAKAGLSATLRARLENCYEMKRQIENRM